MTALVLHMTVQSSPEGGVRLSNAPKLRRMAGQSHNAIINRSVVVGVNQLSVRDPLWSGTEALLPTATYHSGAKY
jgi:hypothetical protein